MTTSDGDIREGPRGARPLSIVSQLPLPPLPAPLTSFVGRHPLAATIATRLAQDTTRLLTLTGPGGVGKTRLALHVAASLPPAYPDGVGYIPLAQVTDPALVLPAIAARLDLPEGDRRSLPDRLATRLRHRRLLLVLDNFEQIRPAAPALTTLLAACPQLALLVTSRAPLHVSGEHVVPVPPLSLPQPGTGAEVVDSEAVQLFVERARAVNPGVTLSEATTPAIAGICARLDGLPLAIELAAVRSSLLSAPAMLAELEHRLPLLAGGPQDQPDRLRTMANAIAWSFDLLTRDQQDLFCRLSVFAGGFSLAAARAIGAPEAATVLASLQALVDHSLVTAAGDVAGEPRFAMLETIREFGRDRLATAGDLAAARDRHAAFFLALAERADPQIDGSAVSAWLPRLDRERPNLRAALDWLLARERAEDALRLAAALWRYWRTRGYLTEGRDGLERALALPQPVPPTLRADALRKLGELLFYMADFGSAQTHLQASVRLFDGCATRAGLAQALDSLGVMLRLQRQFELARQHHARALSIYRALDDSAGQSRSIANLGLVALDQDDLAAARPLLEQARVIAWQTKSLRDLGMRSLNLAQVELAEGRLDAAQAYVESAQVLAEETHGQLMAGMVLEVLGGIALSAGNSGQAVDCFVQCLKLHLKLGLLLEISDIVELLAVAAVTFDAPLATRLLGAAAASREGSGISRLARRTAEYDKALTVARTALGSNRFTVEWQRGEGMTILAAAHEAVAALSATDVAQLGDKHSELPTGDRHDANLTARETEILGLMVQGHTNRAIAETLYISPATVKRHVTNILAKLEVPTRAAAISLALRAGLVDEHHNST